MDQQLDIKLYELQLDILKEQMGRLIGIGGKTIQNIQQQHPKCKIQTPPREEQSNKSGKEDYKFVPVILSGKDQDVFKMAKMVDDVVDVCLAVLIVSISSKTLQRIKDMPGIQRGIQDEIPGLDTVSLERQSKPPRMIFEGYLEDVMKAYEKFLTEAERFAQN